MLKKTGLIIGSTLLIMALVVGSGCTTKAKKELQNPKQEAKQNANEAQRKTETAVDNRTMTAWVTEDQYKNGCVDCHKKADNKDVSLKAKVADIKNHPPVPADATAKTCLDCHRKSPEARAKLANRMHKAHGDSKLFRPKYNGNCASCHGMKDNGEIFVKGAE
ncbi:MAG: hypothetical protein ACOY4Q_03140 [Bacillota bacterium]